MITINGKKEKIYHISLSPLVITLGAESIDIRSYWGPAEPEGFDLREKRRALAKHFEAGSVSLTGLSRHPDPKERGIGPELAACLDGELVFADGHKVRVFCLRRPHAPQEEGVVFQEAMREAARREMADGPAREEPLNPSMAASREFSRGKLRCSSGFKDIWVEDTHYDLRTRPKARLCIQYLCENSAFDPATARYLVDEIDPFVRDRGDYPRAAEIKIQHYFHSQDGKLPHLCRQLIGVVHGEGRYFLKVE